MFTVSQSLSILQWALPFVLTLPIADGEIAQNDSQHLLGVYSGEVEAAIPSPSFGDVAHSHTVGQSDTLQYDKTILTGEGLLVYVGHFDPFVSVTWVKFNGQLLNLLDSLSKSYWYFWASPTVGTHTVEVKLDVARWMTSAAISVNDFDGTLRDITGSVSLNGKMGGTFTTGTAPSVTINSGENDLAIGVCHHPFAAQTFTPAFGQTALWEQEDGGADEMVSAGSWEVGATSVTMSYTLGVDNGWPFNMTAISLLQPTEPPEDPPPLDGINPPQGDPVGDIHFARIRIGVETYFASETLIRDSEDVYGGKKAATLLKISSNERELSGDAYRPSTFSIQVSDTPDRVTGVRLWRGLTNTRTIEQAYIEVYRCQAPYGQILGVPFRLMAGVIKPGGFKTSSGFKFSFDCVDLLGNRFANPLNQPKIPTYRLMTTDIVNLVEGSKGKYAPRVLGSAVEDGVGVVPMLPLIENVNLADLLGPSALNIDVDVWMLSEGAVYDIPQGYYNPPVWGSEVDVLIGDLIRPTPENQNGHVFRATVAGTTGTTEPTWPTSGGVADGSVTWVEDGVDDPTARYPIPVAAYSDFITHPHAPNWTAATGLATQYVDYPLVSGVRRFTPVFTAHDHRYGAALREGRITLLFDVIGATNLPSSGGPILKFTRLIIRLLLDYLFAPTNLVTYGDIPVYDALDGPYSIFDTVTADEAEAVADALGGFLGGFVLAADGQESGLWEWIGKLLRGGGIQTGPNRHGQVMWSRRDPDQVSTITFRAQRLIDSSYVTDGSKRATKLFFRYGKRYANPFGSVATPAEGDPLPAPKDTAGWLSRQAADWGWASGLLPLESTAARDALWNTSAALLPPLDFDNEVTRDKITASVVAQRELDYATGPGPAYHGTMLFEITGPWELLTKLDSNGKTRELGDVIGIVDDEGPTDDGVTLLRGRITKLRIDPETDLVTLSGEILPD